MGLVVAMSMRERTMMGHARVAPLQHPAGSRLIEAACLGDRPGQYGGGREDKDGELDVDALPPWTRLTPFQTVAMRAR